MNRRPTPSPRRPHKLALYEAAVQHPLAEVSLLERIYAHRRRGEPPRETPLLLREDFGGSAALAEAWAMSHSDRQAVAIDRHAPTLRWAARRRSHPDLHLVHGDATRRSTPRSDLVVALNFSAFGLHARRDLLGYFRHARRMLRPGGVLVLDLFGGPGARRIGVQERTVRPDNIPGLDRFTYRWEQRRLDEASSRIDCRIHFELPGGRVLANAFRYDWRLWTLAEWREAAAEAGFAETTVWSDTDASPNRQGAARRYRPVRQIPSSEDFIAYLACRRQGEKGSADSALGR